MNDNEEIFLMQALFDSLNIMPGEDDDPKEFIAENASDIINDETINYVYEEMLILCEEGADREFSRIVNILVYYYLLLNASQKNSVTKYLEQTSDEEITKFFMENTFFAKDLLKNFFLSAIDEDVIKTAEENLRENDKDYMSKIERFIVKYYFLNDYLRNTFEEIYWYFVGLGYPKKDIPRLLAFMFIGKMKILDNEELENLIDIFNNYKEYYIRVIYSDIYEEGYVSADEGIDDYNTRQIVEILLMNQIFELPGDIEFAEKIIAYYLELIFDKDRRIDNRNSLTENEIRVLKRINPLYIFDEL